MNILARFDPGDSALLVAATLLAVVTFAAVGSEVLARASRRLGASARHDLYLAGLAIILFSPAIVLGVARSDLALYRWPKPPGPPAEVAIAPPLMISAPLSSPDPIMPAEPTIVRASTPPPTIAPLPASLPMPEPIPLTIAEVATPPDPRRGWAGALVLGWLSGIAWCGVRLACGIGSLHSLRRRARPFVGEGTDAVLAEVRRALGGRTLPPIHEAAGIPGPLAGGIIRPLVVLPAGLAGTLDAAGLRDVLVHECAHITRRDPLVGLLQRVAAGLFWPHPLVHRLNARLARAREEACDDVVLRSGDACGYARTLLLLAERGGATGRFGPVVGLFETSGKLVDRVESILERRPQVITKRHRYAKLAGVLLLALSSVAVAAIRPGEAPQQATPAAPTRAEDGPGGVVEGQVVDEAGAPVAGASVNVAWFRRAKEYARTGADGRFSLVIPGPIRREEYVRASVDDGARIGIVRREEPPGDAPGPVRIVLKPSRAVAVRVVDPEGKPVPAASVEVETRGSGPIDRGTTDEAGVARFRLPLDIEVEAVAALKEGFGFDYFENYRSWPSWSPRRDPLPAEIRLVLDGAAPASLRALDSQGRPLAGVEFRPMLIIKPGKLAEFNATGSEIAIATTGGDGVARFGWLPKSLVGRVGVEPRPWNHHCPDDPMLKVGEQVDARVLRTVRLAGRVMNIDGSPAPGVMVQAEGRGKSTDYGRRIARTAADGSYAMTMPPDQVAMIAVVDPRRAARALTGIIVREGQPRDDLDLRLVEGTRFVARITDDAGKNPIPGAQLTFLHKGVELADEFRGLSSGSGTRQTLVTWARADAEGRVEVRLAPGDYTIIGHEDLHVEGPGEIAREYHLRPEGAGSKPLTGRVTSSGRPVAGASVRFVSGPRHRRQGRDINARADDQGRFQVEPGSTEGGLLIARSPDGREAGYRIVEKVGEEVTVAIAPAATASGLVVDADGRPLASKPVQLHMEIAANPSDTYRTTDLVATDAEGRYRFAGLVPGSRCEASAGQVERDGGGLFSIGRFAVTSADPIDLATITIPARSAAVPPAAAAPGFRASDVAASNPMPYAIGRGEVEALVRSIGRDPATPEVIAQVGLVVRPQEGWITDLDPIRRALADPRFVPLADRASRAALGKPASTAALVYLGHRYRPGDSEAALRALLATWPVARPGKAVSGVVEDAATGRPVAGATVFNGAALTTTDANGKFEIPGATRGNVWVESAGYALAEAIPKGGPVKVALVRERPVVGRVLERDGLRPVEGATIWVMARHSLFLADGTPAKKDNYGFPLTARTDARGRFALRGLPPGVELDWYEVRHPRFYRPRTGSSPLKADGANDLLVDAGCVVSGEVLDDSGRRIAGVSVGLRPAGDSMIRHSVTTGGDGRYHIGNVPPGRYQMVVEPERQASRTIAVIAEPNKPAVNQVVLEPGWTIAGKVVDAEGRPVADAVVGWPTLIDPSGSADEPRALNRLAYTLADGTFEIAGLAPGTYRVTAMTSAPARKAVVEAKVARPDLVIALPAAGK